MIPDSDLSHLDDFFHRLMLSERRLLILDYDGTLAPFHIVRRRAVPYAGVVNVLHRIGELGRSRLVIVSGRPVREVLCLLPLDPHPEIWGSHGWERRLSSGTYSVTALPAEARTGLDEAYRLARGAQIEDLCERKPASIALHWRGLDSTTVSALRAKIESPWSEVAEGFSLQLQNFDGGIEIRALGCNKGSVVRTLLTESTPAIPAAYLGDDATDEDAFQAIEGAGLSVLVRPEYRKTRARVWLRPPMELLAFLERWRLADES